MKYLGLLHCQNLSYMCSQTLAVMLDILQFAGRPCSKMVEKAGKEQHWFLLFTKFFFVLYKLQEMEREELLKCSNFLPLHTTKCKHYTNHPPKTHRESTFCSVLPLSKISYWQGGHLSDFLAPRFTAEFL